MAITKFYKGFSTKNYEEHGGTFEIYDVNCIQEDLLNEIFTERGSRLYMPAFGTRIPILVFEQNDVFTVDIIRQDLTTVFDNDPRVILQNISIVPIPDSLAIIAVAKITYIEFNVTSDLSIQINSR